MEDLVGHLARRFADILGRVTKPAAIVTAAALGLGGCTVVDEFVGMVDSPFAAEGCKQISAKARAKINWARVPVVEVAVRNDEFEPMIFRLKQGRPYVLRLRNRDFEEHEFYAPEFFRQNAMVTIAVDGQRFDETCVQSVTIPPRQTAEVRMVAIVDDRYEFYDNPLPFPVLSAAIPGGVIVVEERRDLAEKP